MRDEEGRRLPHCALYREAQTALAREDWAAAVGAAQAVLSLEPTHAEAQARLHEVQQQELATWYATGQQHRDAISGRRPGGLPSGGQARGAIIRTWRRLPRPNANWRGCGTRRRGLRIAALYREAQTALAKEDWAVAAEQLQAVLRLEPTHAEAQARLHEVRQQQELATWYATGQQHYDAASGRRPWRTSVGCRSTGAIIRTWRRCLPPPNANWRG